MGKKVLSEDQQSRVGDAPVMFRGIEARAYRGTASPRVAIKAFCLQCVGYVRADVKGCTAFACPLWGYRPYQSDDETEGDDGE